MGPSILVVLGSTREGRFAPHVGRLVTRALQNHGAKTTLIDPLLLEPLNTVRQPLHFMSKEQREQAPTWMLELEQQIRETEGIVLVSSEYNATIPPALSNLLDHFDPKVFRHKPVAMATYSMGSMGGCRARVALLPFVSELGMVAIPAAVTVPSVQNLDVDETGQSQNERVVRAAERMVKELCFYANAIKEQKRTDGGLPS